MREVISESSSGGNPVLIGVLIKQLKTKTLKYEEMTNEEKSIITKDAIARACQILGDAFTASELRDGVHAEMSDENGEIFELFFGRKGYKKAYDFSETQTKCFQKAHFKLEETEDEIIVSHK